MSRAKGVVQEPGHRRVTWAELFFDLVFVFAVTEVSALLRHGDGMAVARAAVVFVPMYWAWVGTTIYSNTRTVELAVDRIGIFTLGLCSLVMAMAILDSYAERGVYFGLSYLALRTILAFLMTRGRVLTLTPFTVPVVVSGPLLTLGGFLEPRWRLVLWAVAAIVDLSTPALLRRRLIHLRFDTAHMPERFGLLLIIALGESIVAIGASAASQTHLSLIMVTAVGLAFALACSLWWVYFVFAASALEDALVRAEIQVDVIRRVLSYGHLGLILSIIAEAVGFSAVVTAPGHALHPTAAALLVGGAAAYLGSFVYLHWRMFRLVATGPLLAAAACCAVLPVARTIPAAATLGLLVALFVAHNVGEHVRMTRTAGETRMPWRSPPRVLPFE